MDPSIKKQVKPTVSILYSIVIECLLTIGIDRNLIFRLRPYRTVSSPMIRPYTIPYRTVGYADTARKPYSIRPYSIWTADCAEESRNYRRTNQSQRQVNLWQQITSPGLTGAMQWKFCMGLTYRRTTYVSPNFPRTNKLSCPLRKWWLFSIVIKLLYCIVL